MNASLSQIEDNISGTQIAMSATKMAPKDNLPETSLKCVSKDQSQKPKHLKYMWLTFLFLLMAGSLLCLVLLLQQYFEYNVINQSRILTHYPSPFPSFTVCNLRPLKRNVEDILKSKQWRTARAFSTTVNNYAINSFYKNENYTRYRLASSIMLMGGYLESFPKNSFADLGHNQNDFIIHCQVTYMFGSRPLSNDCDKIGKWRPIMHAQYINCYMFDLNQPFSNNTNSLELFLYLDESINQTMCIDCFPNDVKSQLSGALILIHQRHTFPNFDETINLQPGTLTEIKLKVTLNRNKLPPYGRCSHETPKWIKVYKDMYAYSEDLCKLITIQGDLNKQCNCNAIEYPFYNSSKNFCSALPRFVNERFCDKDLNDKDCVRELKETVERIACKTKVYQAYNNDIVESCQLPCSFYSYESDRSTSTWPTKSWQLQWIGTKAAKPLQNKTELDQYRNGLKLLESGRQKEALDTLNKADIIERKILAVVINRPNYNVHLIEEKEVFSVASFFFQLGGIISIWTGLTLYILVKVIGMPTSCIWSLSSNKDERKKYSQSRNIEYQVAATKEI